MVYYSSDTGGEHCPVHSTDEFRVPVQHRGTCDARARSVAGRHNLLRRHGVYVFVSSPQHHSHFCRHLGRVETARQSRQRPRSHLPLQRDGRQLRSLPRPR